MYLLRAKEGFGYHEMVTDDSAANLHWIRLGVLRLQPGERFQGRTEGWETVFVLLQGTFTVEVDGKTFGPFYRKNVFTDKATAVYASIEAAFTITNTGEALLEVAVCKARAEEKFAPFVVTPDEVWARPVGEANYAREVHDIVVKNAEGRVHRIIVGETFNPPGNWSSYPPHKHDEYIPGVEACMEEIYYYQLNPSQGFGLQSIYTSDGSIDETYRVRQGDVFLIPRGYHPVCAAGGYQLYYLWLMAGPINRVMIPHDDSAHAWVHQG